MFGGCKGSTVVLGLCAALTAAIACGGESSKSPHDPPVPSASAGEGGAESGTGGEREPSEAGRSSTGGRTSTGGTANGGAPAGGASSGGMAAAGSGGSIPTPDGCEALSRHGGAEYCSMEMRCDEQRVTISCTGSGNLWSCGCTNGERDEDFEIPDVTGPRACAVAAKACADPELLNGEESCAREALQDDDSCSIQDDCQTWHDVDGARLRTKSTWMAKCQICEGTDVACCDCARTELPDSTRPDYLLKDIDLSLGCEFLARLCEAEGPEPTGDLSCEATYEFADSTVGCQVEALCGTPVELEDGTNLTLSDHFTSTCGLAESGRVECNCFNYTQPGSSVFAFDTQSAGIELCRTTTRACTDPELVKPTGPRQCEQTYHSATADTCRVTYTCSLPAAVGDDELSVLSTIGASCDHPNLEYWRCTCDGAAEPIELDAEDAADACRQVVDLCAPEAP